MNDRAASATAWSASIPPSVRAVAREAIRAVLATQPEARTAAMDDLARAVDRMPPGLKRWLLEDDGP